jgi:hypothetical protein
VNLAPNITPSATHLSSNKAENSDNVRISDSKGYKALIFASSRSILKCQYFSVAHSMTKKTTSSPEPSHNLSYGRSSCDVEYRELFMLKESEGVDMAWKSIHHSSLLLFLISLLISILFLSPCFAAYAEQ